MKRRRRLGFPVSILLGLMTILLGYWGWTLQEPAIGFLDALYRGMQLLAFEDSGVINPAWQLEVARFLGVLAVATALLALVFTLLAESADRVTVRFFARRHHIVIGSGPRALKVAGNLADSGERVVIIDGDFTGESGAIARETDLPVITGDPHDPKTFRRARQSRALHAFFCLGDDSENLLALEASLAAEPGRETPDAERLHLTRHVAIENPRLWAALHQTSLTWTGTGAAIQFVSIPDLVAALLVKEAGSELTSGRVLICGSGPTAERTAVRAARAALLEGRRPNLRLAGSSAESLLAELSRNEPWLVEGGSVDLTLGVEAVKPEVAFVIGLPHGETLAAASELIAGRYGLTVVAEVPLAEGVEALRRSGFPVDRVRLISAEAEVMGTRTFELSPREEIARSRHQFYLDLEASEGRTVADNPSLVPWEELSPALKDSNRMFADSVGKRLSDLGGRLVLLTGPMPEPLDGAVVRDLAEVEHERWMTDLRSDGWSFGEGEKDPDRKIHPLLVPFDKLDEAEQAKDEDSIRRLPEALARVGYEIRLD